MHVGFLTPEYARREQQDGGLGNYLRKVALALCEQGHQVHVFLLSDQDRTWSDGPIVVEEVRRAYSYSWIRHRKFWQAFRPAIMQWLCSRKVAKRVWQVHRQQPFSIFQAANSNAVGYSLLKNKKVPIVARVSGYMPMYRACLRTPHSFATYLSDWLELRQVIDADGSFVPSESIAAVYAAVEGHELKVIRSPFNQTPVIANPEIYQRDLQGRRYLVFCGNMNRVREKGLDLVCEILPDVLRKYTDLHFVFIGRDDRRKQQQSPVDAMFQAAPDMSERVHWYPVLPKEQLYPVLQNALGALMPSRFDNYPNICLEMMELGLPIVGSSNSSLDEIICAGKTGFIAQNGNAQSLLEAVNSLLQLSSKERETMRGQVRARVEELQQEDPIGSLLKFYRHHVDVFRLRTRSAT